MLSISYSLKKVVVRRKVFLSFKTSAAQVQKGFNAAQVQKAFVFCFIYKFYFSPKSKRIQLFNIYLSVIEIVQINTHLINQSIMTLVTCFSLLHVPMVTFYSLYSSSYKLIQLIKIIFFNRTKPCFSLNKFYFSLKNLML